MARKYKKPSVGPKSTNSRFVGGTLSGMPNTQKPRTSGSVGSHGGGPQYVGTTTPLTLPKGQKHPTVRSN